MAISRTFLEASLSPPSCTHGRGKLWCLADMIHRCVTCGVVLPLPPPPAYAHDDYAWRDLEEQEMP
jgi:hypothetical protein